VTVADECSCPAAQLSCRIRILLDRQAAEVDPIIVGIVEGIEHRGGCNVEHGPGGSGEFKVRDAVDQDCVAQATPVAVPLSLLLSVQGTNVTWRAKWRRTVLMARHSIAGRERRAGQGPKPHLPLCSPLAQQNDNAVRPHPPRSLLRPIRRVRGCYERREGISDPKRYPSANTARAAVIGCARIAALTSPTPHAAPQTAR